MTTKQVAAKPKPKKKVPPVFGRALKDMYKNFDRQLKDVKGLEKAVAGYKKDLDKLAKLIQNGKYEQAFDLVEGGMRMEVEHQGIYIEMCETTGDIYTELDKWLANEASKKEQERYDEEQKVLQKQRVAAHRDSFCPNCGEDLRI